MMNDVACNACRYWREHHSDATIGRCLRYAPRPVLESPEGSDPVDGWHVWPKMLGYDWCGEWQLLKPAVDQTKEEIRTEKRLQDAEARCLQLRGTVRTLCHMLEEAAPGWSPPPWVHEQIGE